MLQFAFTPPARAVHSLFIHCSASDYPEHDDIAVMRDWHVRRNGWRDVGYHYYVRKDGLWQAGRPLEDTPAAQGEGLNEGTIAICFGGLKKHLFTMAQFRTGYSMVRAICDDYGDAEPRLRVRGHCEVWPKECPVFDYRRAFGLDDDGYPTKEPDLMPQGGQGAVRGTTEGDLYLMVPAAADRVAALQFALNSHGAAPELKVDGIFGRRTHDELRRFQEHAGLPATGIAGAADLQALGVR